MKKIVLTTGWILCLMFCGNITAQPPSVSTAANPQWYYIQTAGDGATQDRVATVVDGKVEGRSVAVENYSLLNEQLWRFEVGANGYVIFHKSTGKKLSVSFDPATGLRVATVSDNPSTFWQLVKTGDHYNIRMVTQPEEGAAGDIYLYQTSAANNYAWAFTGSANSSTANARFNFVSNNQPVVSTETDVLWLYVKNAKTGKCLTDAVTATQGKAYFSLDDLKTDGKETQQWKLMAKTGSRMNFINRATGNVIPTNTALDRYYYLQYAANPEESDGWNVSSIGENQYAVFSVNAAGTVNYWYSTTPDRPTEAYPDDNVKNSAYAWMFSVADEEHLSGVTQPVIRENIRIYSSGKRIYVEGCDDYKIMTVVGTPVDRNENLPAGIYLVTVKGKTTKILVK